MVPESIVIFCIMWVVGVVLNPMNLMAYSWSHLRLSKTLIYIGFLMASNMMWVHSLIHYAYGYCGSGECWVSVITGITMSLVAVYLLRNQVWIYPKDWMRRMIPHHSTALTTSTQLLQNRTLTEEEKELAEAIVSTLKKEIRDMERMLSENEMS